MWILREKFNPNKHPTMPEEYPWQASETFVEGYEEVTQQEYEELLAMDRSAYLFYTSRASIPDVTPRQFRQALVLLNIDVNDIVNAMNMLPEPNRSLAKIEWEYSLAFQRNNPFVSQVGYILNKTPSQLDDIWILASTL